MNDNKVQLNASLRFSPDGQLVGRDILVNVRENSVEDAMRIISDLGRRLSLNLGLPNKTTVPVVSQQPQTPAATARAIREPESPGRCERCSSPLVLRTAQRGPRAGSRFWSCSSFRSRGCLFTRQA